MICLVQVGDNFETFILEGKELGRKIFDADILFKLDYQDEKTAGRYDFNNDVGYLHQRFFELLCKQYKNVDLEKLVKHTVCHEIGHASDARNFARSGIFPYIVKISNRSIISVHSRRLDTNRFRDAITYLIDSAFDYPIDKKILQELGFPDQTAKIRIVKIRQYLLNSSRDGEENFRRTMELFFELPTYIHDYQFGDLENADQDFIKQCCTKYLGENVWSSTLDLLERLPMGNVRKFHEIIPVLLNHLLNLTASWRSEKRESVCERLPLFWDQEAYELLYID